MFARFLVVTFLASVVAALRLNPLVGATSQGPANITWANDAADASTFAAFSLFLHHPSFRNDFAIANNVRSADTPLAVTLPVVPAQDGYTLRATNIGNINEVFSESAPFSIAGEVSSSTTSTTSASVSSTASGTASGTAATGTTVSVPPSRPTTATTSFGVTVSNTNTNTNTGSTGTGTGTSAANTATGTNFNGAPRLGFDFSAWSFFMVALCALTGGAFVAA